MVTLVRPVIDGPTPLYLIEAPIQGTGKGLLAQCIAIIATGGPVAVMTEARDDDEWRKRITAKLREAPPIVLLDNIKRKLDSGSLSSALTEPIWGDRELGSNRMIRVPITCGWFATANNPTFSGELARRIVRIRMDLIGYSAKKVPWGRRRPTARPAPYADAVPLCSTISLCQILVDNPFVRFSTSFTEAIATPSSNSCTYSAATLAASESISAQ